MDIRQIYIGELKIKYQSVLPADKNASEQFVRRMERGVYNWCYRDCINRMNSASFADRYFCHLYCTKIQFLLDAANSPTLLRMISEGNIQPIDIVSVSHNTVWPEVREKERRIVKERAEQKLKKKVSRAYTCAKCKGNETTYYSCQTKAADEAETFGVQCINCGHAWVI